MTAAFLLADKSPCPIPCAGVSFFGGFVGLRAGVGAAGIAAVLLLPPPLSVFSPPFFSSSCSDSFAFFSLLVLSPSLPVFASFSSLSFAGSPLPLRLLLAAFRLLLLPSPSGFAL